MKAVVREQYGPPEVLIIKILKRPVPNNNELLIKVHATTVNRTDCSILSGKPFIIRFFSGLSKPNHKIPGTDFAGTVEAVGSDVKKFKAGDKLWGFNDRGLQSQAEYMIIHEDQPMLPIPEGISFEQAAAAPEGAHYAYNFINKVSLMKGQKVMLNGATGAIGSAALQMLKYKGLYVTATCDYGDDELLRSMGADRVIIYTKEDFTRDKEEYDFVFDAVGKSSFGKCKSLLKSGGVYISSELGPFAENPFLAITTSVMGKKKVKFPVPVNIKNSLGYIQHMLQHGKFKPLTDKKYTINEIADAYKYVESGQKKGNVIVNYHT